MSEADRALHSWRAFQHLAQRWSFHKSRRVVAMRSGTPGPNVPPFTRYGGLFRC